MTMPSTDNSPDLSEGGALPFDLNPSYTPDASTQPIDASTLPRTGGAFAGLPQAAVPQPGTQAEKILGARLQARSPAGLEQRALEQDRYAREMQARVDDWIRSGVNKQAIDNGKRWVQGFQKKAADIRAGKSEPGGFVIPFGHFNYQESIIEPGAAALAYGIEKPIQAVTGHQFQIQEKTDALLKQGYSTV